MNRQCIIGVLLAHIIRRLLDPWGRLFSNSVFQDDDSTVAGGLTSKSLRGE
jgi:hypothetical protein